MTGPNSIRYDDGKETRRDGPPAKVLVVEDREENRRALAAVLDDLGQLVVQVSSGRQALQAASEDDFAVVLMDVRLPEMDGFEAARLLRAEERTRHTPIIFLTAVDKDDRQVSRGYALGAVDYIFKPADPDILRAKVSVLVDLYLTKRKIQDLNQSLERRVRRRTKELEAANRHLEAANRKLEREVRERKRIEEEMRALNADLERRVTNRTAELEAANEEMRAFSYSVSHDLRAPLRKIQYFSDVLENEYAADLQEEARDLLRRVRQCGDQMSMLIADVMMLSRLSREVLRVEAVDLGELARAILEDLCRMEPDREVDVRIEDRLIASGDASLLRLVIDNLLSNAWKFTRRVARPVIELGRTRNDGISCFYIRDNGAGFQMEDAEKLFQPFQRLHSSDEYPGTGIGLAIVHRIIRRHGGRVWAEGSEGRGAKFSFTLPAPLDSLG